MTAFLSVVTNVGLGLLLVFVVFKSGVLGYIYDVRTSPEGIEFLLFSHFVVSIVAYDNVEKVIETSGGGVAYLTAYNYKNRTGVPCFLIRKKRGWFSRTVLVTPRDSESFVDMLRSAGVPVSRK